MQVRIALYMPAELADALRAEAKRLGLSQADVVRLALIDRVKQGGLSNEALPVSVAVEPVAVSAAG